MGGRQMDGWRCGCAGVVRQRREGLEIRRQLSRQQALVTQLQVCVCACGLGHEWTRRVGGRVALDTCVLGGWVALPPRPDCHNLAHLFDSLSPRHPS